MLKNDVPSHEYLLLTDDLLGPQHAAAHAWPGAGRGAARYDGLNEVGYLHMPLRAVATGPAPAPEAAPVAGFSLHGLWGQLVQTVAGRQYPN